MNQTILNHRFDNGLTLVAEPMAWLESTAMAILLPAGCSRDPLEMAGLGNFTCEMVQRGCGPRDNRQFVEDLEMLGVDQSSSVAISHSSYTGAMPAEKLHEALPIFADLVRHPHLPAEQLEDGRQVCFQEVRAVEDDLAQKVMRELRRRRYADPWGRSAPGTIESLERITIEDIRRYYETTYRPNDAIISVAGKFDWEPLCQRVGELFADWQSADLPELVETQAEGGNFHIAHDSSQTHIGVSFPSVYYSHQDYFQARGAVGVLSDGLTSRLFDEVREKRGLCYSVYATMHSLRDRGSVFCYAGTSTDRAQETLDVLVQQLVRLAEGIEPEELQRLKAQVKSSLIMQQESSRSRAAAIASDWYHLGRVRPMEEVRQIIDGLSCESINRYLAANPPSDFGVVTLGQNELEVPVGVS